MTLFSIRAFLPPATKLGQGYVFTGVCHSVNKGGRVPDQVPTPRTRSTPRTRYTTPWDQVRPLAQSMLGDMVNARAVRILLECNLVSIAFIFKYSCSKPVADPRSSKNSNFYFLENLSKLGISKGWRPQIPDSPLRQQSSCY